MTFDIFRVNWILVDSIIIIILLLILCSLKIYKLRHRWRNSIISNSINKIKIDPYKFDFGKKKMYIKKWHLYNNPQIKEIRPKLPTLFIFSSHSLHYLPYAVLEGLCSYGYTINHLVIKKKMNIFKKQDGRLDSINQNVASLFFEYLNNNYPDINNQYWIIDFDSSFSYEEFKNNIFKQIGSILINPSLDQFQSNLNNSNNKIQFNLLFSKKTFLWLRNRKIAKFMRLTSQLNSEHLKITVLDNANQYFKNNETILLALIMIILQNSTE